MKSRMLIAASAGVLLAGAALAQPTGGVQPSPDDASIFGSTIMTPDERADFNNRMRNARTTEEREQIRSEHRDRMLRRAQDRGVTLPPDAPAGRSAPGDTSRPGVSTPGTVSPGTPPPGTRTPGTMPPPPATPPGTAVPGSISPGTPAPGTRPPGTTPPPPSAAPGTTNPGTTTPGTTPGGTSGGTGSGR